MISAKQTLDRVMMTPREFLNDRKSSENAVEKRRYVRNSMKSEPSRITSVPSADEFSRKPSFLYPTILSDI